MKNLKYKDLIMTDEEIGKIVDSYMDDMTGDEIIGMISRICKESAANDPGALKEAKPITKIMYIVAEMYKCGFATALYMANECTKEALKKCEEGVA